VPADVSQPAAREGLTDATAWVWNIAGVSWYQMQVDVRHRLSGRSAVIHAYGEGVGMVAGFEFAEQLSCGSEQRLVLVVAQLDEPPYMPSGDHHRVPDRVGMFHRLGAVPVGVGLAWLGFALFTEKREQPTESVAARGSIA